jgi:hypothetical protein
MGSPAASNASCWKIFLELCKRQRIPPLLSAIRPATCVDTILTDARKREVVTKEDAEAYFEITV